MYSLKESFAENIDFSPDEYVNQAVASILLLHKGFNIYIEKLQDAFIDGIISETEYDQWFELVASLRKDWLAMDFTNPGDILALSVLAKCYMEDAKKRKFASTFVG